MIKMVGKIPGGGIDRKWDRDVDKGRNLRSQERIGVCSTNVETLFYSLFQFFFWEKQREGGRRGTQNGKFTG